MNPRIMQPSTHAKPAQEQQLLELTSAKLSVVITLLSLLIIKHLYTQVEKQIIHWMESDTNRDNLVAGILYQILAQTEADRVLVALYHNGENFVNRMHYRKLSVAFEVTASGISRVGKLIRDIPLTSVLSDLQKMRLTKGFSAVDVQSAEEDCARYLESIGVRSKLDHVIIWKQKEIGILSIHFVKAPLGEEKLKLINSSNRVKTSINELTLLLAPRKPSIWGYLSKIARES